MLCFLVTSFLRLTFLPYYRRNTLKSPNGGHAEQQALLFGTVGLHRKHLPDFRYLGVADTKIADTKSQSYREPFLKKVISQQRTHLRDTKTKSNATEISLFSQQIQRATLSIFLAYISLALPISCNLFVMHFETFVAPQNMQLTGTSNQKLYHINCKTLRSTSHGLTRPIFAQIDFCEINFRGFCGVFWGFFCKSLKICLCEYTNGKFLPRLFISVA